MNIERRYNKKENRHYFHTRFEMNGKQFRPKAETRAKLIEIVDQIRAQEQAAKANQKYNLEIEVPVFVPTVAEVLQKGFDLIQRPHQQTLAERVFNAFLGFLPERIKVDELATFHFQIYINHRRGQFGKHTKQQVELTTIYKELYTITGALKSVAPEYASLEKWQLPKLPALPKSHKKKRRRERLVTDKEFRAIIDELMRPPLGKQEHTRFHRVRLAHQLEFSMLTGFRRRELASLKFSQFENDALLNIRRHKTDTTTKYFPLSRRAVEIVKERRELQKDCEFIFTPDGNPIEANYRTLKEVCTKLNIPYGRYVGEGFIMHDLRHNFGTEIMRESDIETARELLGHANISQTSTYVHTSPERLREAVRKRDKEGLINDLDRLFDAVKNGEIDKAEFRAKLAEIYGF